MFWNFGSAVSSPRQAAGDHVQKSASGDPQQQKQLQDPQQQRASESCSALPWIMTHCSNRLRKVTGKQDKSLQSVMKCYDDIHKNLHDDVMSFNDADALQGIGERMIKDQNAV